MLTIIGMVKDSTAHKIAKYFYPIFLLGLDEVLYRLCYHLFFRDKKGELFDQWSLNTDLLVRLFVIYLFYRAIKKWGNPRAFIFPKIHLTHLAVAVGIFFLMQWTLERYVMTFVHYMSANESSIRSSYNSYSQFHKVFYLFSTTFIGPIYEELIYREAVMTSYFRQSKYFLDILLSALIFGLIHVIYYPWSWVDFGFYSIGGFFIASLYRYTKSVYYTIAFHILLNLLANWSLIYNFIYWNFLV